MILRLFILSSCLFYASRAVEKAEDGPDAKPVTVPTILPQRLEGAPTPKRVYPTRKATTDNLSTTSWSLAENGTTPVLASTVLPTTVDAVVKEESPEEEPEEEQKPPTVEEEFVKVKEQPPKPRPGTAVKTTADQLAEPEDSNFLSFILVGAFLVVCVYLLQHNKKKILGLMFEGRNGHRNVRYRRLSQREDAEQFKEDIIY